MNATIPDALLREFSDFLARRMGVYFPPPRWADMISGIEKAAPALGFRGVEACLRGLMVSALSRGQVEILAGHLCIGETYFYREPAVFAALENDILPPLIAARRASERRLRIWSAGCCTGEEPYSMAILLTRLIPDLADWNLSLLGTDINPHFLAAAAHGVYRDWSFRGVPGRFREDYFDAIDGGRYRLATRYRRLVTFDHLNLVEDVYPSVLNNTNAMDIVLCRNVLMYFDATTIEAVVRRLGRVVVEGGWLIVGPAELNASLFTDFEMVRLGDAILYRKGHAPPATAFSAGVPPPPVRTTLPEAPAARVAPYQRALACYERGDYQRVKALLATAGGAGPPALALMARACANLGELAEACRWCEAAVAADKFNPGLRYLLASVLEEAGRPEAAVATLRQALYLDQDYVLAHFALGTLHRRMGDAGRAARHYGNARDLLQAYPADAPLADAEGLTAGRLREIIDATECIA